MTPQTHRPDQTGADAVPRGESRRCGVALLRPGLPLLAVVLCTTLVLALFSPSTADVPAKPASNGGPVAVQAGETVELGVQPRPFFRNERWYRLGPPPLPSIELTIVLILTGALLLLSGSRLWRARGSGAAIGRHAGLQLRLIADPGVQRMVMKQPADRPKEIRIDQHPDAGIQRIRCFEPKGGLEEYCHA